MRLFILTEMKFIALLSLVFWVAVCQSSNPEVRGKRSYGICGENEVHSNCLQSCNPTCEDRNPYCVQDCSIQGCQCVAGHVRQHGRCVHVSRCENSKPCRYNYECQKGSVCSATGFCRIEISTQYRNSVVTSSSTYGSYSTTFSVCQLDRDCPNLQICVNKACISLEKSRTTWNNFGECRVHNDCGTGNLCVDRTCKRDSFMGVNEHVQAGTLLCRTNSDCFAGKVCVDRICKFHK